MRQQWQELQDRSVKQVVAGSRKWGGVQEKGGTSRMTSTYHRWRNIQCRIYRKSFFSRNINKGNLSACFDYKLPKANRSCLSQRASEKRLHEFILSNYSKGTKVILTFRDFSGVCCRQFCCRVAASAIQQQWFFLLLLRHMKYLCYWNFLIVHHYAWKFSRHRGCWCPLFAAQ